MSDELPREPVTVDEMGRMTIPIKFREALGFKKGKNVVWVEAYPSLKETKTLIVRKE